MQTLDHIDNPVDSASLLKSLRALIAMDIDAFDHCLHQELSSNVPLTRDVTQHIFKMHGKRLRPLLVMLVSHVFSPEKLLTQKHYELAVVIEFVHTATLLHDDVVDHSLLRRGNPTANAIWGNPASVLVGDFLYSRAFQILARHHDFSIMAVLSETTNAIAEGEVSQLMNCHDSDLSEERYFHVITQKTAKLFSAAAEMGAILENASTTDRHAMAQYGLHLGITFQMIDDVLDYESSSDVTGKNKGDDLSEGKATYPLIYAMQHTSYEKADYIRHAIKQGDIDALSNIIAILNETNALYATRQKAKEHAVLARQSLENIMPSVYRDALERLVRFALERGF